MEATQQQETTTTTFEGSSSTDAPSPPTETTTASSASSPPREKSPTGDVADTLGEQPSTWHEATKTEVELLPSNVRFYLFIAEFDIDVGTKLKHAIPHCPPKNKPEFASLFLSAHLGVSLY